MLSSVFITIKLNFIFSVFFENELNNMQLNTLKDTHFITKYNTVWYQSKLNSLVYN